MSNFAQIITSFERAGNFPLEANYIFPTVEELKEFYSDEIQAALLHKGLLKVVENNGDGKQALYWVTKKETNDELEFTELIAGSNISEISTQLDELLEKLENEIMTREDADTAIWGIDDPSNIDPDYNSINDLANQVKALKEAYEKLYGEIISDENSLKNELKGVVGTTDNDVLAYMQTLPYTTITDIAKALDKIINGTGDETDAIDTLTELAAFLEGFTNADTLKALLEKVWFTIEGEILPTEEFRTLRGVEDYIRTYKATTDTYFQQLVEELNNIETGVGLNADGSYSADVETYYLQDATSVMNALKTLDHLLHTYISANTPSVRNEDPAVSLTLTEELDSYVLAAVLHLSTEGGNQLKKNNDGLYLYGRTEYEDGVLTYIVNGNIISQHNLGIGALVKDSYYDSDTEELVFIFRLVDGDTQTVRVPVGELIREWEPYNKDTSPIVLERTVNIQGTDWLSADINLSPSHGNLLVKEGNTLYASGYTTSMYHNGVQLSTYIDTMVLKEAEDVAHLEEEIASFVAADYKILQQTIPDDNYYATYLLIDKNNTQSGDKINIPKIEIGYDKGVLTVDVNGETLHEYYLGIDSVVAESYYDSDAQKIVTVYNHLDGTTETVETSLAELVEAVYTELDKKAPIDSPEFTGNPTVVENPAEDDDSQSIATTSWVRQCASTLIENSWEWEELD